MLSRVCYKWLYLTSRQCLNVISSWEWWIGSETNRTQLEALQQHIWIIPHTINLYPPSHLLSSSITLCLVCPSPLSVVFSYCVIRILHVICRNLSFLFVSNIFICFSFCRFCLRSINHLRICSTNSHLGFLSMGHYLSSITSLLLFLITTINGYVPGIIFYGQMTLYFN